MSRSWNWKAFLDRMGEESWDTSSTFRSKLIYWANEIQDDIISELPISTMKFKLKKLLPVDQEFIDLGIQVPAVPTVALNSGGSLTDGTTYKVYITNVLFDDNLKKFMESEPSPASAVASPTGANLTIDVSAIDLFDGTTTVSPLDANIYRNIYVAKKSATDTDYGEPLFSAQLADNTTLIASITSEPTSTVTPPSASEIDQISSDHMYLNSGNWWLRKENANKLRRFTTSPGTSGTPDAFDYYGVQGIQLFPKLVSTASTAERTLIYTVHKRPNEAFYDIDRKIDLPIICKPALVAGLKWASHDFRDRSGKESKQLNYENAKRVVLRKLKRQRGAPSSIRDVNGDFSSFEV